MAAQARHVDQWVTEGIISRDQAQSIYEYERQVAPSRVTAFEAVAYASSAVAAGVAFAMVADVWHELTRTARVTTAGLTAISLLSVGITTIGDTSPAVKRLGQAALMMAVPAISLTVTIATRAGMSSQASLLMGSVVALTAAAPIYARWPSSPQQIALFYATLSVVLSLVIIPFNTAPDPLAGAAAFAVGLAWIVAADVGWITPRLTGEISGAVAALIGSALFLIGFDTGLAPALAGTVAVAVGSVILGVKRSRVVLTIAGIIALASYVPWLVSEVLGPSTGTPFTLVATAMGLALWATRKSKRT